MHYIDITVIAANNLVIKNIKGLLTIIHAVQTKSREMDGGISVAVDFPDMINAKQHSNFGRKVRLIGDRLSIMAIVSNCNISNMEEFGQIMIDRINPIPENVEKYVMVKRDRRFERFIAGCVGSSLPDIKPCFLAFQSKTNGRNFSLNIVRSEVNELRNEEYTVYGLSYKNSSIPSF